MLAQKFIRFLVFSAPSVVDHVLGGAAPDAMVHALPPQNLFDFDFEDLPNDAGGSADDLDTLLRSSLSPAMKNQLDVKKLMKDPKVKELVEQLLADPKVRADSGNDSVSRTYYETGRQPPCFKDPPGPVQFSSRFPCPNDPPKDCATVTPVHPPQSTQVVVLTGMISQPE